MTAVVLAKHVLGLVLGNVQNVLRNLLNIIRNLQTSFLDIFLLALFHEVIKWEFCVAHRLCEDSQ